MDTGGREGVSAGSDGSEDQAIEEGSMITIELDEQGTVIDLRKAE